ncbi:hypothetical protein Droror1_Dr00025223 [Drosera rotundifolia]
MAFEDAEVMLSSLTSSCSARSFMVDLGVPFLARRQWVLWIKVRWFELLLFGVPFGFAEDEERERPSRRLRLSLLLHNEARDTSCCYLHFLFGDPFKFVEFECGRLIAVWLSSNWRVGSDFLRC